MKNSNKYQGIFPAFYACYDKSGNISAEKVREFTAHLIDQGVNGLYVGGSSGECIYHSVAERKIQLEAVMSEAKDKTVVIAHVACNNTKDSMELAAHAESLGVDAVAAIPPIYFKLPEYAIEKYWNDISLAAPNTDFIIYNIPQLAGVSLTIPLLKRMLKNPNVKGVKNSSMSTLDIQQFKAAGGEKFVVFNGPDEQFLSGRVMGACGGIGGTYGVMPKLYIKLNELIQKNELSAASELQSDINGIIGALCSGVGNIYAICKEVLRIHDGIDIGGVRSPLMNLAVGDEQIAARASSLIDEAEHKYC